MAVTARPRPTARRLCERAALVAAIAVAALCLAAVGAGRVVAADFSVTVDCRYMGAEGNYWLPPANAGFWQKTCLDDGAGMQLQATAQMGYQQVASVWRYPAMVRNYLDISEVTAVIGGHDGAAAGLQQGLRLAGDHPPAGSPAGALSYGPISTVSPSGGTGDTQTIRLSGEDVPGGADRLLLSGQCLAETCAAGEPLQVLSLTVTYRDERAPQIGISPDFVTESNSEPWMKAPATITTTIFDQGSGVDSVSYRVYGTYQNPSRSWSDNLASCRVTTFEPHLCGTSFASKAFVNADTALRWFDGMNHLIPTVRDKAGNETTREYEFMLDRYTPARPASTRFAGEVYSGYLASTATTLRWTNLGETARTSFASGLKSARYDLTPLGSQTNPSPVSVPIDRTKESSITVEFPSTGSWRLDLSVLDSVGNVSEVASKTVIIDTRTPQPPIFSPTGWFGPANRTLSWHPAGSLPAICEYEVRIGSADWRSTGATPSYLIPTDTEEGVNSAAVRAIGCNGLIGVPKDDLVAFDSTPPTVSAQPAGAGWVAGQDAIAIEAVDLGSGVDSIRYSVDGGAERTVEAATLTLSLDEGGHTVSVEAVDRAGNRSQSVTETVSVDGEPPDGWLDALDPERPTLITGVVHDSESGLAHAAIEFRPVGSASWLEVQSELAPFSVGAARLTARFPDTSLADGLYEVRIVAADRAGKTFSSGVTRLDGTAAILRVPLRQTPKVELTTVERRVVRCGGSRSKRKKKCVREREIDDLTVDYGKRSHVRGCVTTADGRPAANLDVELHADEEPIDGKHIPEGNARTGPDGRFEATISAGVNRKIAARTLATELHLQAEDSTIVRTRTGVSLSSNRRRVRPGQRVIFTGQVQLGRAKLSNLGMHVLITAANGELSIRDRRTDKNGRFSIPYVTPRFGRPVSLKLKASVRREYGWPYAPGSSRAITIRVSR